MESQGHYMETFSFLLVIHLCIDLFDFCYFFIVNIYFIQFHFIIILIYFVIALSTHTPNAK